MLPTLRILSEMSREAWMVVRKSSSRCKNRKREWGTRSTQGRWCMRRDCVGGVAGRGFLKYSQHRRYATWEGREPTRRIKLHALPARRQVAHDPPRWGVCKALALDATTSEPVPSMSLSLTPATRQNIKATDGGCVMAGEDATQFTSRIASHTPGLLWNPILCNGISDFSGISF